MIIQQGKTNWILIIVVAAIAGAVGGGLVMYSNDTVKQTLSLSQIAELKKPETTQLQANKISGDVFGNAKYLIGYSSTSKNGNNDSSPKELKMVNGNVWLEPAGFCRNSGEVAAIDQDKKIGVVEVDCNYGASNTDKFLVAFKNLDSAPVQTDFVDIRKNSALLSRDLSRVEVTQISLEPAGLVRLIVMVVPDAQKDAPNFEKTPTEPVSISYHIDGQGKITE